MNESSIVAKPAAHAAYRSFLLRLWIVNQPGGGICRASLEDPHTAERIGFACLEEMFAFLMDQVPAIISAADIQTE